MMLGVVPRPIVSAGSRLAQPRREPGREPDGTEDAPCGLLGPWVPLRSPAGPGAMGVPPGPTRCCGTLGLVPGAMAPPAGPGRAAVECASGGASSAGGAGRDRGRRGRGAGRPCASCPAAGRAPSRSAACATTGASGLGRSDDGAGNQKDRGDGDRGVPWTRHRVLLRCCLQGQRGLPEASSEARRDSRRLSPVAGRSWPRSGRKVSARSGRRQHHRPAATLRQARGS